jgi:hypothetical protein
MSELKKIESDILKLNNALAKNKETSKKFPYKTDFWKHYFTKHNAEIAKVIKELKKQKAALK